MTKIREAKPSKKIKRVKEKIQTTKKLTYIVTAVWVLAIFASYFGVLYLDKDTSFVLATVSSAFMVTLSSYMTKSFLETKESEKNKLVEMEMKIENGTINQNNNNNQNDDLI